MAVIDGIDLDGLDYVVKVPYNGTGAAGGDSITDDLNIWYEVRTQNPTRASVAHFAVWDRGSNTPSDW